MQNTRREQKKGQAAIEFLVTYGWAILGAFIAIGALSYFGIFNTQKYVNDVCFFGDQLTCEDNIAYQNGTIGIQLRNNFGVDISINSTTIKSDYGTVRCNGAGNIPAVSIPSGNVFNINCIITNLKLSTNNKLKYKATVTFQRTNSSNLHNQTGDVMVTVQK